MSEEQAALQEEVMQEQAGGDATGVLQQVLSKHQQFESALSNLASTQAILIRCLMDREVITEKAMAEAHAILVTEQRARMEQQQAQQGVPPSDNIRTASGKLPVEEAPTVKI